MGIVAVFGGQDGDGLRASRGRLGVGIEAEEDSDEEMEQCEATFLGGSERHCWNCRSTYRRPEVGDDSKLGVSVCRPGHPTSERGPGGGDPRNFLAIREYDGRPSCFFRGRITLEL